MHPRSRPKRTLRFKTSILVTDLGIQMAGRLFRATPGPVPTLTLQPFPTKLRLTKHMDARSRYIGILALLLSVIFVGAQFHFCTEPTATPTASHICPICSAAGSAVATRSPSIHVVPATNRLEIVRPIAAISSPFKRATSWRAPPNF